ncbi:MAG: serine/threonine protein kinase, partial [Planctomycetota bacterium]
MTTSAHNAADPYLGMTIDGAILEKKLGQGGMGAVYLARHINLQKYVAIKILPPEFTRDSQAVARFVREARSSAR